MNRYKPAPRKKASGGKGPFVAAVVVLVLVLAIVAGSFLHRGRRASNIPSAPSTGQSRPSPLAPGREAVTPVPPTPHEPSPPNGPATAGSSPDAAAPPAHEAVATQGRANGRLAIIIDDMGSSMAEARSLAAIGVPLTFAIIPGLRSYREVGGFAESKGIERMIHIPMQSKGWPQRRLESNGLLVEMPDSELRERTAALMRDVPGAVGANNHMGSEFTEHEDKMRAVLEALRGGGLYFVDSVTSPQTVGIRLARELGMRAGRRNVFLDNEQNREYIAGQLNQAVRLAKKNGGAIAICHPHPATIAALAALLPGLKQQGIELVPASRIVQ